MISRKIIGPLGTQISTTCCFHPYLGGNSRQRSESLPPLANPIHVDRLLFVVSVCAAVFFAGCGPQGRGLPTAKVTGTVTYAEKSIPQGKIIFRHTSGEMTAVPFEADGQYELDVTVGKNHILVQSMSSSRDNGDPESFKTMEKFTRHIPDRYFEFDTSGLELDVPADGTTFDVVLQDEQ